MFPRSIILVRYVGSGSHGDVWCLGHVGAVYGSVAFIGAGNLCIHLGERRGYDSHIFVDRFLGTLYRTNLSRDLTGKFHLFVNKRLALKSAKDLRDAEQVQRRRQTK